MPSLTEEIKLYLEDAQTAPNNATAIRALITAYDRLRRVGGIPRESEDYRDAVRAYQETNTHIADTLFGGKVEDSGLPPLLIPSPHTFESPGCYFRRGKPVTSPSVPLRF